MSTADFGGDVNDEKTLIDKIRGFILAIFLFAMLGAGTELLLLEHTEDYWQLTPLLLMAGCLLVLGWHAKARAKTSLRAFQVVMLLFIVGGFAGLILHFQGNMEFELEMYPSIETTELIWKSLKGATPALAPGAMIQLGLLGLAFTYRHPILNQ